MRTIPCLVNNYVRTTSEDTSADNIVPGSNVAYWAPASTLMVGATIVGIACRTSGNGRRYEQVNPNNTGFTGLLMVFDGPHWFPCQQNMDLESLWFFALTYDGSPDSELGREFMAAVTVSASVIRVT